MLAPRFDNTTELAAPVMVPSTFATGGIPKFRTGAYAVPEFVTLAFDPGGKTTVVPIVIGLPMIVVVLGNSHDIFPFLPFFTRHILFSICPGVEAVEAVEAVKTVVEHTCMRSTPISPFPTRRTAMAVEVFADVLGPPSRPSRPSFSKPS